MVQTLILSTIIAASPVEAPKLSESIIPEAVAAMTDEEKVLQCFNMWKEISRRVRIREGVTSLFSSYFRIIP